MLRSFLTLVPALRAAVLLPVLAVLPAAAQVGGRTPLTPVLVVAALARAGLTTEAAQVDLPSGLTAGTADPQLRVVASETLPGTRLRVRLICMQAGMCQPFFATVRSATGDRLSSVAALRNNAMASASGSLRLADQMPESRLLAGTRAVLFLQDSHMRITVPVQVIDSGVPGAEVRVSSLDHKQIYRGVVVGAGTVQGSLP